MLAGLSKYFIFNWIYVGWMVETPGAPLIRTYRMRLLGDMRGVVLTDQSVEELQTLAGRLGLATRANG